MKNIKKPIFFREDELPLEVPASGDSWKKMKEKLNTEMPVKEKKRRKFLLFLLMLFIGFILFNLIFFKTKSPLHFTIENTIASKKSLTDQTAHSLPDKTNKLLSNPAKKDNPVKQVSNDLTTADMTYRNQKIIKNNTGLLTLPSKTRKKKMGGNNGKTITSIIESDAKEINDNNATKQEINKSINGTTTGKGIITNADDANKKKEEEDKDEKEDDDKININAGLQWNLQMPLQGASYYFTSANIKNAPWQQLIPGIWISVSKDRQQLGAELNPYFTYLLPAKAVNESTVSSGSTDTAIKSTTLTEINKLIGTSINFTYGYNIKSAWWIQAGVQAQWWRKGITTNNITQEKIVITNPSQPIIVHYKESHSTTTNEWDYINKFQLNINAGLYYQKNKWQAAVRTGLPIAPISLTGKGPARTMRTEFIFRWLLFNKTTNSLK